MSLYIASLNSGSNGNCYYIGNETEAVFVDAGISCREIERRMKRLGLQMQKVKAILISHEHNDHIKGVSTLSKKYALPVYITSTTLSNSNCNLEKHLVRTFAAHSPITIGSISATAFPKFHDAADPHSFIIEHNGVNVGVFTDIGQPCKHVIKYFKECHAAFLESNYDDEMLDAGSYPRHLKIRIKGMNGHLSNSQALDLFKAHKSGPLSHLVLSHLSKNNNCPNLVEKLFNDCAGRVKVVVASRYKETGLMCIERETRQPVHEKIARPSQLTFSFA